MKCTMKFFETKNGWIVLAVIVVWQIVGFLFFSLGPYSPITELGGTLPEERFGYEPDELASWLSEIGDSGRSLYQTFQLWDVTNAAVTAIALTIGLTFTLGRLFPADHYVHTFRQFPAIVFVLELVENLLLYLNVSNFPDPIAAGILPITTMIKLVFGFGAMIFFAITVIWLLINYLRNRTK